MFEYGKTTRKPVFEGILWFWSSHIMKKLNVLLQGKSIKFLSVLRNRKTLISVEGVLVFVDENSNQSKSGFALDWSLVLSFIYPQIIRDNRSHFKIRVLQTIKALCEHLVIVIVLVE